MFEFKHPKYYKNLRKLYRSRNRDQAISPQAATAANGRTPGTGLTTLKKLVTKLNKENEPPSGWQASDQVGGRVGPKDSSCQAREQALRRQAVRESTSVGYDPNHQWPQASSRGSLQADRGSLNSHKVLWSQDRRLGLHQ